MQLGAIGLTFSGGDVEEWLDGVRTLDRLGFGFIGMGDSYLSAAVAARETIRARVGTAVTNPVTRHPSVMARDIAMVDQLSGGRAVLGVGRGFGHVHTLGLAPATTAEMREYLTAVRHLLRGENATWRGNEIGQVALPRDSQQAESSHAVPVMLSAYGPRTLRLAGEVADGAMIASAANPSLVAEAIAGVRKGAEDSGRDPDDVSIWLFVRGAVADTREDALAKMKGLLAASIQQVSDATDPDVVRGLAELRRRYRLDQHAVWDGANALLLDELGLTEYAADRLAVLGTPDECRERLQAFADLGVDCVCFPASQRPGDTSMQRLVTEVWPARSASD
jgi:5,10-methylenetetrahydromethanopterin reductase